VLDLYAIGLIDHNDMRRLMDAPSDARRELRLALWQGLSEGSSLEKMWADALLRQTEVELGVPCEVSAFTRFEDSSPWAPMASAGRASSVAASGQQFHRPHGLLLTQGPEPAREASADPVISPQLGVTRQLVFEEGLAAWARAGVAQGAPVSIAEAESYIAGLTLINDWCARNPHGLRHYTDYPQA
jgi:fumarylacetoacetase